MDTLLQFSGIYSFYEKHLESEIVKSPLPNHLAIVLDGNRRWAKFHLLDPAIGHNYGADKAEELLEAIRKTAQVAKQGDMQGDEIDEKTIESCLYTSHLPQPSPDLILRTSGEKRLSGFLIWQSAYSELMFMDVFWPEFRKIDLMRAIRTYQRRVRRYGK